MAEANRAPAPGQAARAAESGLAVRLQLRSAQRKREVEIIAPAIRNLYAASVPSMQPEQRSALLLADLAEILRRDLAFRGHLSESSTISSRLLAWIEFGNGLAETLGKHVSG